MAGYCNNWQQMLHNKLINNRLMPRSHQSLNMFKSCLVKHGLKLFSLKKLFTDVVLV